MIIGGLGYNGEGKFHFYGEVVKSHGWKGRIVTGGW